MLVFLFVWIRNQLSCVYRHSHLIRSVRETVSIFVCWLPLGVCDRAILCRAFETHQDLAQAWIKPADEPASRTLLIVLSVIAAVALAAAAVTAYRCHRQSSEAQESGEFAPLQGTA